MSSLRRTPLAVLLACLLLAAGCGGDSDDGEDGPSTTAAAVDPEQGSDDELVDVEEFAEDPEGAAEELADELEDLQESQGGGGATLQLDDGRSWEFSSVLCAFGPDEIGQEGAEVVVSGIADGLQIYVSIDSFGHFVTLDDIENFEEPRVALAADPFILQLLGEPEEFIVVDGRQVSATTSFADNTAGDGVATEGIPGSVSVTCP